MKLPVVLFNSLESCWGLWFTVAICQAWENRYSPSILTCFCNYKIVMISMFSPSWKRILLSASCSTNPLLICGINALQKYNSQPHALMYAWYVKNIVRKLKVDEKVSVITQLTSQAQVECQKYLRLLFTPSFSSSRTYVLQGWEESSVVWNMLW